MSDVVAEHPELKTLIIRVNTHDRRLDKLETAVHGFDKDLAILKHQLSSLLELVEGIGKTIRTSIVTVVVGAVLWAIAQMAI